MLLHVRGLGAAQPHRIEGLGFAMLEPAGAAAALAAELDAATPEDPCGIIKGEQPSHIRLDSLYARTLSGGLGPLLDRVMRRRRVSTQRHKQIPPHLTSFDSKVTFGIWWGDCLGKIMPGYALKNTICSGRWLPC